MKKIVLVLLWLLTGCTPHIKDQLTTAESIGILSLNLHGVVDLPCRDSNAPTVPAAADWRTRYQRIADWARSEQPPPDIIALQEVHGWLWCPTNYDLLKDYEALGLLVDSLNQATGLQYRIAYLVGFDWTAPNGEGNCGFMSNGQGSLSGCQIWPGHALLYNSRRLRNVLPDSRGASVAFDDNPSAGIRLKRSLPCCDPRAGSTVCSMIDGDAQTDKCGRPTPSGPAFHDERSHSDFSRFELVDIPGSFVNIYNVHLHEDATFQSTLDMINTLEPRFASNRLFPPIVTGDFNRSREDTRTLLPSFDAAGFFDSDVVGVLLGSSAVFSSQQTPRVQEILQLPLGVSDCRILQPELLWSDHCGIFVRISP